MALTFKGINLTGSSHTEKTSAAGTIAGFDFQYYFFLYKLLNLKKNEFIGFEALDDVHTELDTEHQVLIQVKHTVQKKANNDAANLTELDIDLWKTLNNWVSVISDKNDGRQDLDAQKHFVEKTFLCWQAINHSHLRTSFYENFISFKITRFQIKSL